MVFMTIPSFKKMGKSGFFYTCFVPPSLAGLQHVVLSESHEFLTIFKEAEVFLKLQILYEDTVL
jgi:hypothetical protein